MTPILPAGEMPPVIMLTQRDAYRFLRAMDPLARIEDGVRAAVAAVIQPLLPPLGSVRH